MGGGEWERIIDKFLYGSETSGSEGGEETHTLIIDEMPNHNHKVRNSGDEASGYGAAVSGGFLNRILITGAPVGTSIGSTGGNQAHNNMPPYVTINIWERVK